jgi:hypothetical protein
MRMEGCTEGRFECGVGRGRSVAHVGRTYTSASDVSQRTLLQLLRTSRSCSPTGKSQPLIAILCVGASCFQQREHTHQWKTRSLCGPCRLYKKSSAFSPQANYTNRATATGRRILVPTFADRWMSCGQRGGTPMVVNLSFLHRSRYFSFK